MKTMRYTIRTIMSATVALVIGMSAMAQTGIAITSLPIEITESGDYYIADNLSSTATTGNIINIVNGIVVSLDLNGKTITSTKAGAVIIANAGTLTILDSSAEHTGTIDGKDLTATEGRGIRNTGTLLITGGNIINCKGNGGPGVTNYGGELTIDGQYVTISNCTGTGQGNPRTGGGVWNTQGGTFYLKNGKISGCTTTAYRGGGVASVEGCTFIMSGGIIENCTTTVTGAGVWNGGEMAMSGGTITGCTATGNGGGIFNSGILNITKGNITSNKAALGGGIASIQASDVVTINATKVNDVIIDGNRLTGGWGGGIFVQNGTLNFYNGTITNNYSNYYGGGIALHGATSTISGGYIAYNTATNCGGAIHTGVSSHSDIGDPNGDNDKLIIEYNQVTKASETNDGGGGISVGYEGTKNEMSLYACTIRNNTCNMDGGGIYLRTVASATFNNVEITSGLICDNEAKRYGGGFYTNGQAKVSGGTFRNNKAGNNGGGIYMGGANIFTMTGGCIDGNESNNNGGGVWAGTSGAQVNISGGEFINNISSKNGGGFFANGKLNISGSLISNNEAVNGGGFYINGGTVTFTDGELSWNSATKGGGFYDNGGTVTFSNGKLEHNEAVNGGGIYLATQAKMKFTDGLIAYNNAKKTDNEITTAYNAKTDVSGVNGCGGGIYLQSGTSSSKTTLTIEVVNSFGLYGNTADRAGDDIVAEGSYTSVTVPNVIAMDLKDFEGKDAQPNWYEDYVYIEDSKTHDTQYNKYGILHAQNENSGKRFRQMLEDDAGEYYNHLLLFEEQSRTFPTKSGSNDGYVCLSLGYMSISAIIQATGLNEKESMYFILEHLLRPDEESPWTVKESYPVLLSGTADTTVQRVVRNIIPGTYRIKQFQTNATGATPWAWAYTVNDPEGGVIQKKVTKEDGIENLFPFTVQHISGEDNVFHDEEYKVNEMLNKSAIQPGVDVEDMKNDPNTHHIVF